MEKKFKNSDSENDYKYLILQIGRKYTYVGFTGLHKPVSVINTPNFFLYNEEFHSSIEDDGKINELMQFFLKKKEIENDVNKETLPLLSVNSKKEEEKSHSPKKVSADNDENEEKLKKKIEKRERSLIYHYEYKYNQNMNLWETFFEEFLFRIFQNLIKTSAKIKKVIVVLNMFYPTIIKYTLCKSLIENLEISSISYINDLISPLYLCNCNTCIVIDLGYLNCRLLPVINGLPLYHHYTYINNGGFYINNEIRRLLKEQYIKRGVLKNDDNFTNDINNNTNNDNDNNDNNNTYSHNNVENSSKHINENMNTEPGDSLSYYWNLYPKEEIINVIDNMPDSDIESIKLKYCYIKNDKNNFISDKYILFQYQNYEIIIEPDTRWKACEILFNKNKEQNLYSLFSNLLEKLSILEISVFYNLLLVGGCSNIKGVVSKVAETLFEILKEKKKFIKNFENKINFLFPKIAPNLRQFIGASIYSNLDKLPDYTEEHLNNNLLYDHLNEDVYINFKN